MSLISHEIIMKDVTWQRTNSWVNSPIIVFCQNLNFNHILTASFQFPRVCVQTQNYDSCITKQRLTDLAVHDWWITILAGLPSLQVITLSTLPAHCSSTQVLTGWETRQRLLFCTLEKTLLGTMQDVELLRMTSFPTIRSMSWKTLCLTSSCSKTHSWEKKKIHKCRESVQMHYSQIFSIMP